MTADAPYVDTTDSSATIMRGVAAALQDEWMVPQPWPRILTALTGAANRLPVSWRQRLIDFALRDLGIPPGLSAEVTAQGLAEWAVSLYEQPGSPQVPQYDTIVIGAPSGGIGQLAALLGAPFLSEHFVSRYRYSGDPDDVAGYQAFGARLAETILANNPDLLVVNHYDPIHDRFLVPHVNYLRMKLLSLPLPYRDFIRRRLRPGGTLLFADCRLTWGQYRISRRHRFQVGGLGGVTDTAYVGADLRAAQMPVEEGQTAQPVPSIAPRAWTLPFPWFRQRESEWGSLPTFRRAVEAYAAEHGYRFLALNGTHPEDFSRVAFYASYQAMLNQGQEPSGVLVECFTLTSPTGALRAGLLPLWLPFNCVDSLRFLTDMASQFPRGKPVLLAPVPAFSPSPDVAGASDWVAACGSRADVRWLGTDPSAYPVDLAGLFRFLPALQAWCAEHPARLRPTLLLPDLEALIRQITESPPAIAGATGRT